MSSEPDVIIIGAGASGLSAAKELKKRGYTTTVVEGSHRIGGRAYSEEIAPNVWFDLGCSYLHQADRNPFIGIADDLGVTIGKDHGKLFDAENTRVYFDGNQLTGDDLAAYNAYMNDCFSSIIEAAKQGKDIAIADIIDMDSPYAVPFMENIASEMTKDVDECSTACVANSWGGDDVPILNGYGNLVKQWGSDVEVSLNTRVEKIDWSGTGVSIETSKGTVKGRVALTTVSTGILGAGDILFDPVLPAWKMDAILGLPTGTENKICLHFDKDIFGPDGRGWHKTWNSHGDSAGFEASVMGQNTAIVFTGGRHGVWLEKQGQQAGHDYAVDRVAEVFGNGIRERVNRSIVTAWTTEPWTRGSYSCTMPGQAHQRLELAKPLDDRLFFAGEASIVGPQACCHGAFLSGQRAAEEIADVLG